MRPREKALIERLREIVRFVEGIGKGVAVVENGDCTGWEDAKRVREITGAHSVMIATAAESNPSVFSCTPLVDIEQTLVPAYCRLCKYLDNHMASTKFCVNQFKGVHHTLQKSDLKVYRDTISKAKEYDDLTDLVGGSWTGEEEMRTIMDAIRSRSDVTHRLLDSASHRLMESQDTAAVAEELEESPLPLATPPHYRPNPEPPGSGAPLGPSNEMMMLLPAGVSRYDAPTPTPGGGVTF